MSAMDLFEDGFPHSTREGYERGCRGSACLGKLDHGFSCADAFGRSNGDYRYQRMVADGLTPAQIAEAERPLVPVPPKRKPRSQREKDGQLHTVPTVTVKDSEEPIVEKPKRARLVEPKKPGRPAQPIEHGTPKGYGRGCRENCPGHPETGVSCREAMNAYLREYKQRRAANGGEKLGPREPRRVEKPRVRKLAEAPVRVKVKCLFSKTPTGGETSKAVSFVLLRNGAVRGRKFHPTWEHAMARARVLVAEYRGDAS